MTRRQQGRVRTVLFVVLGASFGVFMAWQTLGQAKAPVPIAQAADLVEEPEEEVSELAAGSTPREETYRCEMPDVPVDPSPECAEGLPYPRCTWRIVSPERAGHLYEIWRNTRPEHRRGRPALVSVLLATAAEYARRYPGERMVIGDLDAPGPRHMTHRLGQDVDLYLPGSMIADNHGMGEYPSNYLYVSRLERRLGRARVEDLGKILSVCSGGRLRIYYNDYWVVQRLETWFWEQGFETPFESPILLHNDLHRFHFHVTLDRALEPLPVAAAQ